MEEKLEARTELETRLVLMLAPMLLTVAVFCLTAVSVMRNNGLTITDEIMSFVAFFSIFAASLLIDFALDNIALTGYERLSFLGFGYPAFCITVSLMAAFVPILYESRNFEISTVFSMRPEFILFFGAGFSVFMKMMIYKDRGLWLCSMVFFSILSVFHLAAHR